jgi:hypothetical protein
LYTTSEIVIGVKTNTKSEIESISLDPLITAYDRDKIKFLMCLKSTVWRRKDSTSEAPYAFNLSTGRKVGADDNIKCS